MTLDSSIDAFDILKSIKNILSLQPSSIIHVSSDGTLYQPDYMKKFCDQLEVRRSNEEVDLIIKYSMEIYSVSEFEHNVKLFEFIYFVISLEQLLLNYHIL